ncbi:hypothetical protein [Novispirillum itersonii]|uniref:hypothetical protein n=1 Tax=Novispirillum itersonii TaxID=189 RepID=UPI0003614173|nr:hypothetical protein [Novispirillum itersonii]
MVASVVGLCNLSLSLLGAQDIAALDEASPEARACARHFGPCLEAVLRDHPWNFATRRVVLAPLAAPVAPGWTYAYALPPDCLLARELVVPQGSAAARFSVEYAPGAGRVLLTDLAGAALVYTARTEDTASFDPLFVQALSWRLAAHLAMPLTRDRALLQMAQTLYLNTLTQAQRADANEGVPESPRDPSWIAARGIASGWDDVWGGGLS